MKIYSKGGKVLAEVSKFQYNGTFMGESYLTFDIDSPEPINFEIGAYAKYRGERYELNYTPAKLKASFPGSTGDAFKYKGLKFNSLADELTRCDFLDFVLNENQVHFSNLPNFSFYAQSVQELADRLQANLNRVYTGEKQWTVTVEPSFVSTGQNVVIDSIKCWEALQLVNSLFKGNFVIRGKNITIGTAGLAVEKIFGYGKDNGLFTIEQQTNNDALIITRLRAYGSTRNIPDRYYNNLKDANGKPLIPESQYVKNLMLPSFAENGGDAYIDSPDIDKIGVRESTVFFDGSDSSVPDIYPSLEGMTAEELKAAGFSTESTGELDAIVSAEQISDNGEPPIEGQGKIQGTFWVTIKDIGFDINDHRTTETAQISMKTGMCAGRAFDITKCEKTTGGYKLTLKRDEDSDLGLYFPYNRYNIKSGDKFVLLEIEMPDVYIKTAEQKLLRYAQEYLNNNDKSKYTYVPKIDSVFMARNPQFHDTLKEGDIFNFKDADLGIDASVIIQSLTIKEGSTVPEYDITLFNDKITSSSIEKIQNAISSLANNIGITAAEAKGIFRAMINDWYPNWFNQKLHKDANVEFNSVKTERVTANNVSSERFVSGPLGEGYRINEAGEAEFQNLTVRGHFSVSEFLIQQAKAIGGKLIVSPASIKINSVEEITAGYKCTFNTDKDTIVNPFIVEDLAFHQVFDGTQMSRYWRLITETGSDYLVLSKTDCEEGSNIPQADDEIILLGNRTSYNRQSAIIISAYDNDSPYIGYYSGINTFSLLGKEVMREGNLNGIVDKDLGQLYGFGLYATNVYLKGAFHLMSGQSVESAITDSVQEGIAGIRVGAENLLNNTDRIYHTNGAEYTGIDIPVSVLVAGETYTWSFDLKIEGNFPPPFTFIYNQVIGGMLEQFKLDIDATQDWERYSVTFTYKEPENLSVDYIQMSFYCNYGSGSYPRVRRPKLERGTIATDWSPSVADQQAQIDEARNTANAAQESVSVISEQVTNLIAENGRINASVTSVTKKVDNLKVGGENIVSGTGTFTGEMRPNYTGFGELQAETFRGNVVYQTKDGWNGFYFEREATTEPTIISFYARKISGNPYAAGIVNDGAIIRIISEDWKQYYFLLESGANLKNLSNNGVVEFAGGIVQYSSPKVEFATTPSDWSPSLLDQQEKMQEKINDLQVGTVNILNHSGNFTDTVKNWYDNDGGLIIDNTVKYLDHNTIRTSLPGGIYGDWYKLETDKEYCYCAMIMTDADIDGSYVSPLHYWAGKDNKNEGKIVVSSWQQTIKANEWTLCYIVFKLSGDADSFRPIVWGGGSAGVHIAFLALAKGNKPLTQWSPSISDQNGQINSGKIFIRGTGGNKWGIRQAILNNDGVNIAPDGRGLNLITFRRSDMSVVDNSLYDTYDSPEQTNSLISNLNSLDDTVLVTLTSYDECSRLWDEALNNAIIRCGGSGIKPGYRDPYAFIGIPGIGKGNGIEVITNNGFTAPFAEISTQIENGVPVGMNGTASMLNKDAKDYTDQELRAEVEVINGRISLEVEKITETINGINTELSGVVTESNFVDIFSEKKNHLGESIISSINVSPGTVLIESDKIVISGKTKFIDGNNNEIKIFGSGNNILTINNGVFNVDNTGRLTASNADIQGRITAQSGTIGAFEIVDNELKSEALLLSNLNIKYSDPVSSASEAVFGYRTMAVLNTIYTYLIYARNDIDHYPGLTSHTVAAFHRKNNYVEICRDDTALKAYGNIDIGRQGRNSYIRGGVYCPNVGPAPGAMRHLVIDTNTGRIYHD